MIRYLVVLVLICGLTGVEALAQQPIDALRASPGAYYRFADSDDITMELKVWGAISNPGLYEVRRGLNLSTLLSLAGGPLAVGVESSTRRTFTIRLFRPDPGAGGEGLYQMIFENRMQDQILMLDRDPLLSHGDVLVMEERIKRSFSWRDGLAVVTAVASLVLVADNVFFD